MNLRAHALPLLFLTLAFVSLLMRRGALYQVAVRPIGWLAPLWRTATPVIMLGATVTLLMYALGFGVGARHVLVNSTRVPGATIALVGLYVVLVRLVDRLSQESPAAIAADPVLPPDENPAYDAIIDELAADVSSLWEDDLNELWWEEE